MRTIWSPRSLRDLETIHARISEDSPRWASLVVQRLIAAAERARDFPRVGRVVPEVGDPDLREIIVRPFRLVYRVSTEERLEVVTVFRASQLLPPLS